MVCARKRLLIAALAVVVCLCGSSRALIMVGDDKPIENDKQGWPKGALAAANMGTRISWWEGPPFGGGEYHFQYVCKDTEQFNEMLEVFSKIDANGLELAVHNGPMTGYFGDKVRYDCDMTVWVADNFNMLNNRSRNFYRAGVADVNQPIPSVKHEVPAPRIDVYVGGGGAIVWEKVFVPCDVKVIDLRPGSVDAKYTGKGLVRAKVIDGKTKKAIVGAEVELFQGGKGDEDDIRLLAKTDAQGACLISGIPTGIYDVTIVAKGYVSVAGGRYDNRTASLHDVSVSMLEPVSIVGCIVDVKGKAMEGLDVEASDFTRPGGGGYSCAQEASATTDADGRFEIKGLPPGFVRLRCRSAGLYQSNHIMQMWQVPTAQAKLVMVGTSTIKGEVIGDDGRRVTGSILWELEAARGSVVGSWGGSGQIKDDGTFEIKGVPPDDYVIWAQPNPMNSRFEPVKEELTVKPGKVYELILTLGTVKKR